MKQSIAGIFFQDGKFLIGHRLSSGEMGNRWEFPGGKVDPGETPEVAITREFQEEMGITVSIGNLIATAEFTNRNGRVSLLAYQVFLPSPCTFKLTEHSELKWASMSEIEQLNFVDSDLMLLPGIKKWCSNETDR